MRGAIQFGHSNSSGEFLSVVTAGLTVALLVYTVQIVKLNELRVKNGARTNQLLAEINGKIKKKE